MARATTLTMGMFGETESDYYRISGQDHCKLQELELDFKNEAIQEVMMISSLQDLSNEQTPPCAIATSGTQHFNASQVLERMKHAAPDIARDLALKMDAKSKAPFRLIMECQDRKGWTSTKPTQPESFIALSYCWHNDSWCLSESSNEDCIKARNFSWPISKYMTKALLSERTFSNEGIWVDQCCINQANNDEKLCVVGFMDQIYRRARLVVVVLEDIAIDDAEEAFLEDLMEKYNQGTVNDLYVHSGSAWAAAALLLRISSARWFSRAWCNHELLVSKDQVFFIRVEPRGFAPFRILRVSGAFLVGLINVTAAYMTTPDVKDERHVILKAQYHNLQRTGFMSKLLDHFESNASLYHDEEENQLLGSNETKSFMDVFLYCSALGASVEVDKLIITLNIVGCELYFQGTGMTQPECVLFLSILALASGDPTVLCNSGEKLMLVDQKDKQSWLQWPQTQDFRGYSKPSIFRRLDYVPDFSQEQVRLDLLVFGNDTTVHQASEPFIAQAARFVDGYIEMSKEQSFAIDESQGQRFFQRRDTNIKVWACALECGLAWFDREVASEKGFDPRLREALQTFFSDDAARYSFRELCGQNRDQCEIVADSIEAMASIHLDSRDPFSIPAWIQIGASRTDSILIMCPEHRRFTTACPVLLLHEEHTYCKRIFLLDAVQGRRESWKIVGKTAAVGAELMALMEQGMLRRNQLLLG